MHRQSTSHMGHLGAGPSRTGGADREGATTDWRAQGHAPASHNPCPYRYGQAATHRQYGTGKVRAIYRDHRAAWWLRVDFPPHDDHPQHTTWVLASLVQVDA